MDRFALPHRWVKGNPPAELLEPQAVQDNFEAVEAGVSQALATVPQVTSLPDPTVTPEVDFVADATNGVIWRFRYRAASSSAYKWELVGGSSLYSEVATAQTLGSTGSYVALATAGPLIALPLAGDYDVEIGCRPDLVTGGSNTFMSYDIGGTGAVDADAMSGFQNLSTATIAANLVRSRRKTGLAAVTLTAKYKASAVTPFAARWMRVTPVRVG